MLFGELSNVELGNVFRLILEQMVQFIVSIDCLVNDNKIIRFYSAYFISYMESFFLPFFKNVILGKSILLVLVPCQ